MAGFLLLAQFLLQFNFINCAIDICQIYVKHRVDSFLSKKSRFSLNASFEAIETSKESY